MSVLFCAECDRPFDPDVEVEAVYYPVPRCEDCLLEQQLQEAWANEC